LKFEKEGTIEVGHNDCKREWKERHMMENAHLRSISLLILIVFSILSGNPFGSLGNIPT
jgi:hypothetical protein